MKNLYDETRASKCKDDLDLRVYTSNLLGQNSELVLHGGGNTSVKSKLNAQDVLYIKGGGWDLESIQREGFAPVKLDALLEMIKLEELSDSEMVRLQREAMLDKNAPVNIARNYTHSECDIPKITKVLSVVKGYDVSININQTPLASFYASLT